MTRMGWDEPDPLCLRANHGSPDSPGRPLTRCVTQHISTPAISGAAATHGGALEDARSRTEPQGKSSACRPLLVSEPTADRLGAHHVLAMPAAGSPNLPSEGTRRLHSGTNRRSRKPRQGRSPGPLDPAPGGSQRRAWRARCASRGISLSLLSSWSTPAYRSRVGKPAGYGKALTGTAEPQYAKIPRR